MTLLSLQGASPAEQIARELVVPFLQGALSVIALIGGLALWVTIIAGIMHIIEYKLMPAGVGRAFALWSFISQYKAFFIGIIMLYVLIYTVAFTVNYLQPGSIPDPPHVLALKFIGYLLVTPFVKLYEMIVATGWRPF